jgi:urocanate hydratase
MCPCHDPFALIPVGMTPDEAVVLRSSDRDALLARSRETMIRMLRALNGLMDAGCIVFEYGTFIRKECVDAGISRGEAFRFPGCIARYVRPMFFEGRGPFRWTCISGDPTDQARLDDLALSLFPNDPVVQRWIPRARAKLPIEGLPARICFLGFGQRKAFGLAANELVRSGELKGPVAFSRDNLDCGSVANPAFETEDMIDGSDAISDWPYLNALLNTAGMADLVAIQANGTMGISAHTGVTMIADGTDEAVLRLEACLTTDAGIGIVRHAQAGYPMARKVAEGDGPLTRERINVPLWWSPDATFGPNRKAS